MPTASGARVFASPLAKKLASEKGIELAAVRGTGPHNRIIAADVEEYVPGEIASMCSAPMFTQSASKLSVLLILDTCYVPAAASAAPPVAATSAAVGTTEFTDMETSTIRKVRPELSQAHCAYSNGRNEPISAYPRARCLAHLCRSLPASFSSPSRRSRTITCQSTAKWMP